MTSAMRAAIPAQKRVMRSASREDMSGKSYEGEYFAAPLYENGVYLGVGGFLVTKVLDSDRDGVLCIADVIGADTEPVIELMTDMLHNENGLLHLCAKFDCKLAQRDSEVLHMRASVNLTKQQLYQEARKDFASYGQSFWCERIPKETQVHLSTDTGKLAELREKKRKRKDDEESDLSDAIVDRHAMRSVTSGRGLGSSKNKTRLQNRLSKLPDEVTGLSGLSDDEEKKPTRIATPSAALPSSSSIGSSRARLDTLKNNSAAANAPALTRAVVKKSCVVSRFLVDKAVVCEKKREASEASLRRSRSRKRSKHRRHRSRRRRKGSGSSKSSASSRASFCEARVRQHSRSDRRSGRPAGHLYEEGYGAMMTYLPKRGVAAEDSDLHILPLARSFWTAVARPRLQKETPAATISEMRTLTEAMDHLARGELAELGDVLMGRFQAIETSLTEGWKVARHLEALPLAAVSSVSQTSRTRALNLEAKEVRPRSLRDRVKEWGLGLEGTVLRSSKRSPPHPRTVSVSSRNRTPSPRALARRLVSPAGSASAREEALRPARQESTRSKAAARPGARVVFSEPVSEMRLVDNAGNRIHAVHRPSSKEKRKSWWTNYRGRKAAQRQTSAAASDAASSTVLAPLAPAASGAVPEMFPPSPAAPPPAATATAADRMLP